jgi:hypothetical protein
MIHRLLLVAPIVAIAIQPPQMPFTNVARGATSSIETARTVVVRNADEWRALWKEHAGHSKAPAVDFASAMIVAVFMGTKPTGGYAVEIAQIEQRDGEVVVTYRERRPGPDDITTQALTSPFHIVRTESRSGRVTFERAR